MYQDQCYLQPCLLWETLPKDSWRDLKYFLYNIWYGKGVVDVLCLHNNYRIERQSIIFLFNLIMQTWDQGVSAVYEPCIMLMISHSSYLIRCALISFYFIQCTAMISLHLPVEWQKQGEDVELLFENDQSPTFVKTTILGLQFNSSIQQS